jgi:hypothetical protein
MCAALLSVGLAVITSGACNSDVEDLVRALGEGCLVNSDCDSGLVCVFRRCHVPCESSEDCPTNDNGERLRCVVGEKPVNVCQLVDELRCERHGDCPLGQVCALDNRCRDGCASDRDCVGPQVCRAAACAEPIELVDNQIPVATEGSLEDKPCRYSSECPPGPAGLTLNCQEGICSVACYEQRDCARFYRCTTADDPTTPGDCELIGERGSLFCDPIDEPAACVCPGGTTANQICKPDGSGFEPCPCP